MSVPVFVAWAMGLFYAIGGLVHMRALAVDDVVDDMLAMLGDRDAGKERLRTRIMTAGAALTFASGVSLMMHSRWTLAIFACNTLLQGAYLLWARQAFPPQDAMETVGRRSTIRAFLLYLAAFAFVLVLDRIELWRVWVEPAVVELAIIAALIGATSWFVRGLSQKRGDATAARFASPGTMPMDATHPRPPLEKLRFMPEYHCSPLWDDESGGMEYPPNLGLSDSLVARIQAWDEAFQATYCDEDPLGSKFETVEIERAWVKQGEAIAADLGHEWPGTLNVQISALDILVENSRVDLDSWDETPEDRIRWIAERCGIAEIEAAIKRLDALARQRADLPEWDGDTQDDIAAAQSLFKGILSCVPARYIADVAAGLRSPEEFNRAYVALALAGHERDAVRPFLDRALASETVEVVRIALQNAIEQLGSKSDHDSSDGKETE